MKNIQEITKNNSKGRLSMVTCYDYTFAKIISKTNVDMVLVGDSAAMVIHGYENTIPATINMMQVHVQAVSKGLNGKFLIADMPFLEHRKSMKRTMESVDLLMKAGANAIKIEGGSHHLETIEYIVNSGIPVMGHLGLTPQSVHSFGGWKLQGKIKEKADIIETDAKKLEDVGVFSLVLEMIPNQLSTKITKKLNIPTIGIGAGPGTSGQVLVLQDILGLSKDFNPTFARKYVDGYKIISEALNKFDGDVKIGDFPKKDETF